VIRILNQIDICIKYGKPSYVHCLGGKGRTGTIVGCYLAVHGFAAGNDVIRKMNETASR
jgi:protein-tyrosine phosphatase